MAKMAMPRGTGFQLVTGRACPTQSFPAAREGGRQAVPRQQCGDAIAPKVTRVAYNPGALRGLRIFRDSENQPLIQKGLEHFR
jgi:hypothetical protein